MQAVREKGGEEEEDGGDEGKYGGCGGEWAGDEREVGPAGGNADGLEGRECDQM